MTEEQERVVIRDNRKIDPLTGEARKAASTPEQPAREQPAHEQPAHEQPGAGATTAPATEPATEPPQAQPPMVDAALLDERTADLQRVQAEYANYRKRAERDRLAAGDLAVGRVIGQLLPVVDDLDRARAHGDLAGPLKAVADKLESTFAKLGLVAFGAVGDPFDPAIHEAVLHDESDTVTVPTCTMVMRQGYKHGERLLRPAMVGVTDPRVFIRAVDPTADAGTTTDGAGSASAPQETEAPTGTGAGGPHGDPLQDAVDTAAQD